MRPVFVVPVFLVGIAIFSLPPAAASEAPVRHDLRVLLDPTDHAVEVDDLLTLPVAASGKGARSLYFLLHAGLEPTTPTARVALRKLARSPSGADFGIPEERFRLPESPRLELWELRVPRDVEAVALSYGGVIHHPVRPKGEDYARSFGETPGTVSEEGAVLAGTSYWVPWFGEVPFAFTLEIALPGGWDAVSQGRRVRHERAPDRTTVVWESPEPQTEVYLVAARFVESTRRTGKVEAMAFLRSQDEGLAAKYLEATGRYLAMYEKLLGPYPYAKFALVENFWETGYGMPSFTLLGPRVIRLPFILNSSYPHEILHNWWGNGVYVDSGGGNWCEGLTAYLADHLLQEQSKNASEYRQTTLQKYADYVSRGKDFPLSSFRERHSPATEAIGYGKSLLFFHELRRELGDASFVDGLRRFYERNRFRAASFDDLRVALEEVSGRELGARFEQALERTGAPRLALRDVEASEGERGWVVEGTVVQTQSEDPFELTVPAAVTLEGRREAHEATIDLSGRETEFRIRVPGRPLRLDLDPVFDVFRRLEAAETPPALTRAFGAERALAVLPSGGAEAMRAAYRALVEEWRKAEPERIEIATDAEVAALPSDRTVWVFGWENRWRGAVAEGVAPFGAEVREDGVVLGEISKERAGLAAVAVARHGVAGDLAIAWVAADRPEQVPGLGRKLPHYHKYSYLAFEGDEPTNVAKGRWPVVGSPLTVILTGMPGPERGALAPRRPLATPPPAFSTDRLGETVRALSAAEMEGRAPGSAGHAKSVAWISEAFRQAGLVPAGDGPSTFARVWEAEAGTPARRVILTNLIGRVPGAKPGLAKQAIVVGAHFDHLGTGWPEARAGNEGKLHPGADDNASGVAALLALARAFASGPAPDRTVLFAAFDGEEAGRIGSRRLVEDLAREGIEIRAMVNLDSIGRLGAGKILVLGTGSASEWVHIFRGAGFVTGHPVESVAADPGGSDQVSFHEAGIPAVQLFTGPHLDYHSPGDVPSKIDLEGIAKVAAIAREAIEYLAGREEPLTTAKEGASKPGESGEGRRVFLGTIPDFAFPGPGVRLDGVVPGSPAEAAGLREGDVVVALSGEEIADLRGYSAALKRFVPGDRIDVTILRAGERLTVSAHAVER